MSRVLALLGKGKVKPPLETVQKGLYQTLFQRLLAQVPNDINPSVFAQMKLITAAVNNMSEETAKDLAGHIKRLGAEIERYESEYQKTTPEDNG